MKDRERNCKNIVTIIICMVVFPSLLVAQGLPAIRNYTATEYGAHNHNYDITVGDDGMVFVANFEGLLYYDRAEWHIIHTEGINRLTVVYRAENSDIWVGGYNYLARVQRKENGQLYLERIGKSDLFNGEVMEIYEDNGCLFFLAGDGNLFEVNNGQVFLKRKTETSFESNLQSTIIELDALKKGEDVRILSDITQDLRLPTGLHVLVKNGQGLEIKNDDGQLLFVLNEANGLCSNNVSYIDYDYHGLLWGATDHGIFSIELPFIYSFFLPKDGLLGEVHSILAYEGEIYIGTNSGVFMVCGESLKPVPEIRHCCWKLRICPQGMLAATASGLFLLSSTDKVSRLTTSLTMDVLDDNGDFFCGEVDGVYYLQKDGSHRKICDLEKVSKMIKDSEGTIWLQNVYGKIFYRHPKETSFKSVVTKHPENTSATIVQTEKGVIIVNVDAIKPFSYPAFSEYEDSESLWLTDNEGKHLYQWKGQNSLDSWNHLLAPISSMKVSALFHQDDKLWVGSDENLTIIHLDRKNLLKLTATPRLLFRSVILDGDSVLWGGFGEQPKTLTGLKSDEKNLRFVYSLDYAPLTGQTFYRYKLNDDKWSSWSESQEVEFLNLTYGSYTLTIQALLANGELSEEVPMNFSIAYPFYLRWYMTLCYIALLVVLTNIILRIRIKRLKMDKEKLERIVKERTSEVVKQKDEIEVKSKSLEKALQDLENAQHELIQQEKMATVGKLTQGLVDRIQNPMNYVNNFSHISSGLLNELKHNLDDEKDQISEDCYEDSMDVINMVAMNLQKIEEHGNNTSRTLKAMEEMLKERNLNISMSDLAAICRKNVEMIESYYADDISSFHMVIERPEETLSVFAEVDAAQVSKVIMSILTNCLYAVKKKSKQIRYDPVIRVNAMSAGNVAKITIYDNGIGIENTIIDKVFDPFFTTKTTAEAVGVGMYLSKEVILNHNGDITVESKKNEYTIFSITIPIKHESGNRS